MEARFGAMPLILTQPVVDRSAWFGSDFERDESWIYRFSANALDELEGALRTIRSRAIPLECIEKSDFPLPTLERDLGRILDELQTGRGFVLLRGLPMNRLSDDEAALVYWGLGCHLGKAVSQNARGDRLGHVRDEGYRDYRNVSNVRGYQTRASLEFHTDSSDIVGLLCLRKAKEGGESSIVSSTTLHNEILKNHRELLGLLYKDYFFDRRGEEAPGEGLTYRGTIYSCHQGVLSCRPALLEYIYSASEKTGIPLSQVEDEALSCFRAIAERADLRLTMRLEPGDVQLLHNSVVLHSRTDYVDFEEPNHKRHLLRLWLNVPNGRPIAPTAFLARRNGVPVTAGK